MTRTAGDIAMRVGVAKETAPGERRVALVPESVDKLRAADLSVLIERGAGAGAWFADIDYAEAGAKVVTTSSLYTQSDVILRIRRPSPAEMKLSHPGQVIVGMLEPLLDPKGMAELARMKVTAISIDAIPRTLSRAQDMDALSSQANLAGYKAVLIAAEAFGRYFPLLTTPAGTAKPARVLVLGVGVAGLQAIATARRLGAQVKAYDIRSETREQAESLGAQFITPKAAVSGGGRGGYARALTAGEQASQQAELTNIIASHDVVITTAQVPGRKPPVLVSAAAVAAMKPGSVVVDIAAGSLGGNCELSTAGKVTMTPNGIAIHAPQDLAASMPAGASAFYSRNIANLLLNFVKLGELRFDFEDEVAAATVITYGGKVVQEATKKLLQPASRGGAKA
jgi:NAD(P) transhydrogenase subunit alpha